MEQRGDNPYASPAEPTGPAVYPLVSVRAVGFVIGMTVCGGIVGAGAGSLTAALAPGYYEAMFGGPGAGVNPAQIGFGLGLTQGAGVGFVGALAMIAITYFLKFRRDPGVTR